MKRLAWVRREPTTQEAIGSGLLAVATAAAVGAVTWYLTRTLLSRDPISLRPQDEKELAPPAAGSLPPGSADAPALPGGKALG